MKNEKYSIKSGPIAWMAGNSIASNLLMIVLLAGGLIVGSHIKQEVFPEFDMDIINITVLYPGASPQEIEQGILLVIEEAVQGIDEITQISSMAKENFGTVTVEAIAGANLQKLANDIQKSVDRITSFPDEAEDPEVTVATHHRGVISVVLYGNENEHILRDIAENIRDTLLQNPVLTQVELSAIKDLEISIEVPQEKLREYNLTLDEIARKLHAASVELPSGGIKTPAGEVLVRIKERRNYGEEFTKIPLITGDNGTNVLLEDIATVYDGFEDTDNYATYNGMRAIMIDIYRVGDQTPIDVADAVKTCLKTLEHSMPTGIKTQILNDRSEHYRQRLNLLVRNGYLGLLLVFIMLGLFLESRLAFWVAMGIPISFLGSLLFLPVIGVSINMVSMFAFIISLGIVVDDAIVVGENIYNLKQKGIPFKKASILATRDVVMPVTFSILTNIIAFLPLWFIPGVMGKIFSSIPAVVITVFIISLIESIFVLPSHAGHLKDRKSHGPAAWIHKYQQQFSNNFTKMVKRFYAPFLKFILEFRYIVVAVGVLILLIILSIVKSDRLGMTLFPRIESDYAKATIVLPYGSAIEKTEAARDIIVNAAKQVAAENGGKHLVKGVFAQIGSSQNTSGSHTATIRTYLTPAGERPITTSEFTRLWRKKTGSIAGIESLNFRSNSGGPGSGANLTIEISHKDLDVLASAGNKLAKALKYFPNVYDINDGFSPGKQQIDISINKDGLALGLTAYEIARKVRHAFYGTEVLRQQRGRNEIRIMVRLPENERESEFTLEELMIKNSSKIEVPLRQVVNIKRARSYTEITRRSGHRVVSVTADVNPPSQANMILTSLRKDILPDLIKQYPGLSYSFEGKQADMRKSINSLSTGLFMSMLIIYALLAILFKSYSQPAIIMASVPFGIVGAILGHMFMGYSLSVMSMFGVVALSGVVINDSLVLIDFANKQKTKGFSVHESIHSAGIQRFRPIMLTTITTFGGLAPMIFETSKQARYLIPMALSLGYGVLFATVITLILVPCLYIILDDFYKLSQYLQLKTGHKSKTNLNKEKM